MPRIFLTGLALLGLVACGGKPQSKPTRTRTPAAGQAASKPSTQSTQTRRTTAAKPDTSTQRNPLTNKP